MNSYRIKKNRRRGLPSAALANQKISFSFKSPAELTNPLLSDACIRIAGVSSLFGASKVELCITGTAGKLTACIYSGGRKLKIAQIIAGVNYQVTFRYFKGRLLVFFGFQFGFATSYEFAVSGIWNRMWILKPRICGLLTFEKDLIIYINSETHEME